MPLPVNSDFLESGPARPARAFSGGFSGAPSRAPQGRALAAALVLALLGGCTGDEWPDRDPLIVDRAPVDSLEFLPLGSRFSLEDSLTPVRVRGFRRGYACTRILAFDLEERAANRPPGFAVRIRMQLPETPDCALDTSARDSVLDRRFSGDEGPFIHLLDSLGQPLDTTTLVRGRLDFDSLELKSPALSASKGRFYYRDTTGSLRRILTADSLSSCEFLNHAEYRRRGDTTRVRYSWVTLDPAPGNDSCRGAAHGDTLFPVLSLP